MAITEVHIDPSLQDRATVTITHVTTTASVAHTGHGYSNSDTVKIFGADQAPYNGNFVISNVSANAYDYTMLSDPGANATGTIKASKVNIASSDGSQANPWADAEYASNNHTASTTQKNRFNIKSGTKEILAAAGITTFGTPSFSGDNWAIQGYGTNAGDGVQAEIDCNGFALHATGNLSGIGVVDVHVNNGPTGAHVLPLSTVGTVIRCKFSNCPGGVMTGGAVFPFNEVDDCGDAGGTAVVHSVKNASDNWFYQSSEAPTICLRHTGSAHRNIIVINVAGATDGISTVTDEISVNHNTIVHLQNGTGQGFISGANRRGRKINSNAIEGFSGVGGIGVKTSSDEASSSVAGNAVNDCTTEYDIDVDRDLFTEDNEESADFGSPSTIFAKVGTVSVYADRLTYWQVKDLGNLRGGAFGGGGRLDKGAVQSSAAGLSFINTRRNSLIGR